MKIRNTFASRVVSTPGILGGMPVVEGTRVPAANVMAEVKAGKSKCEIFESYPTLPLDGVEACIQWDRLKSILLEEELANDDGKAAKEHLAAGRPIYYGDADFPEGLVKKYPDGRKQLVSVSEDGKITVIRNI